MKTFKEEFSQLQGIWTPKKYNYHNTFSRLKHAPYPKHYMYKGERSPLGWNVYKLSRIFHQGRRMEKFQFDKRLQMNIGNGIKSNQMRWKDLERNKNTWGFFTYTRFE